MSSILKKKGRKKKKKKPDNNEIIPQRHERIGNLNYYSEEIAKNMIEKIISLAISSNFMQNVNKNFDNFCIDMMSRKLDNIVEMIHINREKDDFDIDNIDINSEIKYYRTDTNLKRYKNVVHEHVLEIKNDKAEDNLMTIANVPKDFKIYMNAYNKKIEDCLDKSTIIQKNKYLKKNKFYQYNIDIKDRNFWGCITQPTPTTIDRSTSNFNCYISKKENKNKDSQDNAKNKKKEKNQSRSSTKKYYSKIFKSSSSKRLNSFNEKPKDRKDSNLEDENSSNKKKKFTMINLPFYPIENLELRKESEEILNLRKEQLELILQKEKELQELKQSKIKIRNDFEKNKKKKKGKYTVDNEGKIVMINEIKPENLLKEFYPVMSKQKEVKLGKTLEAVRKEKIKMENNAKKNIAYNEADRQNKLHYLRLRVNNFLNDINKNNDYKEKENSNSKDSNSIMNQNKRQTIDKSDDINDLSTYQFEPSGSNFDIMNPSIGVKIQEKFKVKNGGVNFYEKFHKYSINEFNKTLQDTLEWTKYKLKERQNDGYMVSTNHMANFKKILSIKEEKNVNDLNNLDDNNNIKKKKFLHKTYSSGFNKNMAKSKSDIYTSNDKFPILKEILLHEDQNEKNMMVKLENYNKKHVENILGNRKQSSISRSNINRSMIEEGKISKKIYSDVDDFNKKLIMGNAINERTNNRNIILPKISNRNNDINFNNTMIQFHRTRLKKGRSMGRISSNKNNNRDDKSKKKGMKRVNSVKVIQ